MKTGNIYYGDCLELMEEWKKPENWTGPPADLIYMDPPFNSDEVYNKPHKKGEDTGSAQDIVFTDIWEWDAAAIERTQKMMGAVGHPASKLMEALSILIPQSKMLSYISYMAERLAVLKDFLKSTGSIYLHFDPYANYYLRMLMDAVFGQQNFRNEIIWKRRADSHNLASKHLGKIHDVILWYANSNETKYRIQYLPYEEEYVKKAYKYKDERGKYRLLPCTNETGGNKIYEFMGIKRAWRFSRSKMEELYASGMLVQLKTDSVFNYKKYLDDAKGVKLQDLWCDIPPVRGKKRQGYPTEKPVPLLERIIRASSNEGDLVLDPFCGCGTALEAAALLGRRFIGIDISLFAVKGVSRERLRKNGVPCAIEGIPKDLRQAEELAKRDKHKFEWWASESMIPGGIISNKKKGADSVIDGRGRLLNRTARKRNLVLVQVKGGKPTLSQVRDFAQVIQRERAAAGVFITLRSRDWSRPMQAEANSCGKFRIPGVAEEYPVMQHWAVEEQFGENPGRPKLPPMRNALNGAPLAQTDMNWNAEEE